MDAFMGLDSIVIPTPAFQAAAQEALRTYGAGPSMSGFGAEGPKGEALVLGGGALMIGAGISTLVGIYIFRHVNDEKNTFWKAIGYGGGILSMLSALSMLFGTVGLVAATLPVRQP